MVYLTLTNELLCLVESFILCFLFVTNSVHITQAVEVGGAREALLP